jgi:hypothetical protein
MHMIIKVKKIFNMLLVYMDIIIRVEKKNNKNMLLVYMHIIIRVEKNTYIYINITV